jgi:hypothetical protein
MRRAGLCGFVFFMFVGGLRAQQGGFSAQLTPEERHRAGLDNQTPEERAALDELVAGYGKALASNLVVEPSPQAIERRAREAPTAREGGGWLSWIKIKPSEKAPDLVIESRLAGTLRQWAQGTVFRLENGQAWRVSDYTSYVLAPPVENPVATIRPDGFFGAFILEFPAERIRIRVVPAN